MAEQGMVKSSAEERQEAKGTEAETKIIAAGNRRTESNFQTRYRAVRKKRIYRIPVLFLAAALLLGGCGASLRDMAQGGALGASGEGDAAVPVTGRYVEEELPVVFEGFSPLDLFPVKDGIYLAKAQGMDGLLVADGDRVRVQEMLSEAFLPIGERNGADRMAVADNGARIFGLWEDGKRYFMTPEGEMREWDHFAPENYVTFLYGRDGYFYAASLSGSGYGSYSTALCRVDVETGETEHLWEFPEAVTNLSVCGDYLFAGYNDVGEGGILIYSISRREQLEEDSLLTKALKKYLEDESNSDKHPYLIMPSVSGEGIYVLTREGLFYHVMYGNVMEQVIPGDLCSIGDISRMYAAMCVTEDEGGGMPVFWIAYDSGEVVRFTYDEEVPAVPETLVRVYSLQNDNNVRQAVTGYQARHPEAYIQYETGMTDEDGQTRDDALKNLATRIAAGDGPDVFVMDGLPLDSYLEKGVLMDLTETCAGLMDAGVYFENVTDCFYREGKLYTVPMAFQITLLMGETEQIEGVDDLEDFAALLEEMDVEGTSRIGLLSEERILTFLAMVSGGWLDEDGEPDREALSRFLTLCRRVYLADGAGMSEDALQEEAAERLDSRWYSRDGAVYDFINANPFYWKSGLADSICYFHNPLSMGSFGGDTLYELNYLLADLGYVGMDYGIFSDGETACMPLSMLAVNQATGVREEALDFVEYALSADFQSSVVLKGIPVNKGALYDMEKANLSHRPGNFSATGWSFEGQTEESVVVEVEWASLEDFEKLNDILDGINQINIHDAVVYDTVMELGASAVNGEKDIEETVDAIAKKVQLYLAE